MSLEENTVPQGATAASATTGSRPPSQSDKEHAAASKPAEDYTDFKPSREFLLAMSALMVLALAAAFDATSMSVALPDISTALGGTALEAFWAATSFLLASTVLQPTMAGLSTILGRKYVSFPNSFTVAIR